MWKFIWFILTVLPLVVISALVVGIYINLLKLKNEVENAWSDIDVELGSRASLVDKLVKHVKGSLVDKLVKNVKVYAENEKSTLKEVTEALSRLVYAETVKEIGESNRKLTVALEDFFSMLKNYPDLRASERFEKLMEQLEENEYLIAEYQYFYNEMVYVYNSKCQSFPYNAVANYFGFEDAEFFESETEADDLPDLDLDSERKI